MANDYELKVRIGAELKELRAALQEAKVDIRKLLDEGKRGGNNFAGVEKSINGIKSAAAGLAATLAAAFGVKAIIDAADQIKTLDARLKLATDSAEQLAIAQAGLIVIANETRSPLANVIELYGKLAISTKDLHVEQGTLLNVTNTVSKAVKLSGASAEAANAAIIQFAQGLASGTLRGDELNSVLEQTPRLAQAIAAGLGVPVGKLRELGEQGKITAAQIVDALTKQKDVIDKEFGELPVTVGDAMTQLKNSLQSSIGDIDKASGATASLAGAIQDLAQVIATADFGPLVQFVVSAKNAIGDLLDLLGSVIDYWADAFGEDSVAGDALGFLSFSLKNLPTIVIQAVQEILINFGAFFEKLKAATIANWEQIKAVFTEDTVDAVRARYEAEIKNIEENRKGAIKYVQDEANAHIAAGEAAAQRFKRERVERAKAAAQAKAIMEQPSAGIATPTTPAGVVNNLALQKAAIEDALREQARLFDDGKIRLVDYYNEKRRLSALLAQVDIDEANRKLAKADKQDERDKAATEVALAKLRAQQVNAAIDAEEAKANEKRLREAETLQIELTKAEGRAVDARRAELEAKYRDTLERMKTEGDEAGIAIINKLIDTEVAKTRFDILETQAKAAQTELDQLAQTLAAKVGIGDVTPEQADQQIAQKRAATIAHLQAIRDQMQQLAETTGDPQMAAGVAALNVEMQKLAGENATGMQKAIADLSAAFKKMKDDLASSLAGAAVDSLSNFFMDIVDGSKSAGEALKDFVRGFARSMAQIAARALATFLVLQALDAIYPGLGQATVGMMNASSHHTGGVVGQGAATRRVSPMVFAGAPRYHTGGVAGLRPGEVPAILQKGEEVLTKNDPRNVMNGGGNGSGVRIVNVVDPNLVHDFMTSGAGERVIVNAIQRNAGSVKQVLA